MFQEIQEWLDDIHEKKYEADIQIGISANRDYYYIDVYMIDVSLNPNVANDDLYMIKGDTMEEAFDEFMTFIREKPYEL